MKKHIAIVALVAALAAVGMAIFKIISSPVDMRQPGDPLLSADPKNWDTRK